MRGLIALALACGCGGPPQQTTAMPEQEPVIPINVEWKVEQGQGHTVNVALVVDGRTIEIGVLEAATELEAGTPATCALRAASPRRTELVCGDLNGYSADLVGSELLVTYVAGDQRNEVKRVPVNGEVLAVKLLSLPY